MSQWKLRDGYFKGPDTYTLTSSNGERVSVEVDENGCFQLDRRVNIPLGIFAKLIRQETTAP